MFKDLPGLGITSLDSQSRQVFVHLTNHFDLAPEVIAEPYKNRWKIEKNKHKLDFKTFE